VFEAVSDSLLQKETFFGRKNGGGSIMEWGGISARGTTTLVILSDRQDSFNYQQTLTTHLLPFGDEVYDGNYVFQHDIASFHTSRAIQAFLQDVSVKVLKWPALSPDLNPVENVWGELVRTVYHGGCNRPACYSGLHVCAVEEAVTAKWSYIAEEEGSLCYNAKMRVNYHLEGWW
jgi:hypothetical protein